MAPPLGLGPAFRPPGRWAGSVHVDYAEAVRETKKLFLPELLFVISEGSTQRSFSTESTILLSRNSLNYFETPL